MGFAWNHGISGSSAKRYTLTTCPPRVNSILSRSKDRSIGPALEAGSASASSPCGLRDLSLRGMGWITKMGASISDEKLTSR